MSEQIDLDALERLADAATPGPWDYETKDDGVTSVDAPVIFDPETSESLFGMQRGYVLMGDAELVATAAYIAAVNPVTVKALVQRVRDLDEQLAVLAKWVHEAEGDAAYWILALRDHVVAVRHPLPVILHCPRCHVQHIDVDDESGLWATERHHRKHLCKPEDGGCGHVWQPANVYTVGVAELPQSQKEDSHE